MQRGDEFENFHKVLDIIHREVKVLTPLGSQDSRIAIDGSSSALQWWLRPENRRLYPQLSQMAIDIFSIPPIIYRASLSADMVEITQCLSFSRPPPLSLLKSLKYFNFIEIRQISMV